MVKYKSPRFNWMHPTVYESIEFPLEDLDKRIEHYRNKIKIFKGEISMRLPKRF